MKIGLHTVDLFPGRERLMPFRTVLEVARVMRQNGWEADVLNSSVSQPDPQDFEWQGVKVRQCPRNFDELSKWVNRGGYDAFVFAATFREGLRDLRGLRGMTCHKMAYIPSGVTPKANAWWLLRMYGRLARAWMLEALTPKLLVAKKLKKAGFSAIIALTDTTAKALGQSMAISTIYPGQDDFSGLPSDDSVIVNAGLKGQKFFLFTGGPAEVRGAEVLLRAFDRMADETKDAHFVFLMRHDVGANHERFLSALSSVRNRSRISIVQERLTRNQLKAFMEEAYALVLPFICIPAEVPLTYFEAMSCGTPVVSFPNAGTTDYLKTGLMLEDSLSEAGLARALATLWQSPQLRASLSEQALALMKKHPSWDEVGAKWMKAIDNAYE